MAKEFRIFVSQRAVCSVYLYSLLDEPVVFLAVHHFSNEIGPPIAVWIQLAGVKRMNETGKRCKGVGFILE